MLERVLRWLAAGCGVAAAVWLPALTFVAPILPAQRWTVLQLAHPAIYQSLARLIQDVRQLGVAAHAGTRLDVALRWAAAIPLAVVAAGICGAVALVLQAFRRTRGLATVAVASFGLAACAYAIAAAWWVTEAARHSVRDALARVGGTLHVRNLPAVAQDLQTRSGLHADAALYVLALGFAVLLLLPGGEPPSREQF